MNVIIPTDLKHVSCLLSTMPRTSGYGSSTTTLGSDPLAAIESMRREHDALIKSMEPIKLYEVSVESFMLSFMSEHRTEHKAVQAGEVFKLSSDRLMDAIKQRRGRNDYSKFAAKVAKVEETTLDLSPMLTEIDEVLSALKLPSGVRFYLCLDHYGANLVGKAHEVLNGSSQLVSMAAFFLVTGEKHSAALPACRNSQNSFRIDARITKTAETNVAMSMPGKARLTQKVIDYSLRSMKNVEAGLRLDLSAKEIERRSAKVREAMNKLIEEYRGLHGDEALGLTDMIKQQLDDERTEQDED